ncbi:ankyrin repeat-containing domain protein [Aspergillus pseudonomiae]|uniref:Ankyrin repeat-containing domain protein n=1 Tax=Aspergillus pseudonomiae TaxID=1506151 RepID=A0A5N7DNJ7_9EURO|nr:ankyrin repeat-containing domain protein [Aspergillus pseudonomiae]KAB8255516.1 ankyrin repeat-containing domain protein [Aspergillus pseudonomiae]KAE8408030.1 ankyrin repeat-containing domain protein [Aspergillus pseudonomiae]
MSFSQFHNPSTLRGDSWDSGLRDTDGSIMYETEDQTLREEIIRRNDVETLKQYIGQHPKTGLEPEPAYYRLDVFFVATQDGCIDALRVLLAYYHANLDKAVPLERRDIVLLNVACKYSQLETVQFLLDSQPPLGNIHDKGPGGETAILSAAESFTWPGEVTSDRIKECLVRSEELMYMLLDKGASVNDVTMVQNEYNAHLPPQPCDTVLSLAISRASYTLVKRLIEQGANVHAKQEHADSRFGFDVDLRDVTALHYGSIYWNIEGVRALLDHPGNAKIADMVSVRDTIGDDTREQERHFREDEILPRYIGILKILLTANPSTINMQDNQGSTALHYDIIQFLCENGADASISNYEGQTALHLLALCSRDCDPIDTATDKSGATALHTMSMCLRQIPILQHLLKLGADATIQDSEGDTPLHKLMRRPYLRTKNVTLAQRMAALDKITVALQEAGKVNMMNQPNAAGQTPQQLRAKIVAMWQKAEEHRIERDARGVQGYGH